MNNNSTEALLSEENAGSETSVENTEEELHVSEESEQRPNVAVDLSENTLDAQDAAPESIRRGRILIAVILTLAAIALTVIIIAPPLGWKPAKKQAVNYRLPEAVTVLETGKSSLVDLKYAPVFEPVDYVLQIEQKSNYESHSTTAKLHADLRMMPVVDESENHRIILKIHEVDVHILDDDREVALASAGAMLSGISLFSVLDEKRGIGTVVPDANINPQVGRVLYMMLDAVRYLWPALPEEQVGTGAVWEGHGMTDNQGAFFTLSRNTLSLVDNVPEIGLSYTLNHEVSGHTEPVGNGHGRIILKDGNVVKGDLELHREARIDLGVSASQDIRIGWAKKKVDGIE